MCSNTLVRPLSTENQQSLCQRVKGTYVREIRAAGDEEEEEEEEEEEASPSAQRMCVQASSRERKKESEKNTPA
jgi:hypothetical protein